jgi:hypothetical protein
MCPKNEHILSTKIPESVEITTCKDCDVTGNKHVCSQYHNIINSDDKRYDIRSLLDELYTEISEISGLLEELDIQVRKALKEF